MNNMKVLSLFDGISCGYLALQRAGIPIETYYASEIDKTCIKVSQKHFPNIIQLGDVNNWRTWDIPWKDIDLVMGGFCCQSFSSSGKGKGFIDARGRLFFCFSDIVKHLRKETKGKVLFLGENVRMRDEHRWVITEELGVEPVEIDSALVSAQTRHRLYWCNWSVEMPKDKHISLDDILEHDKGWNPEAIRGRYIGVIVGRRIGEDGHRKDYDKNVKITQCLEVRRDKNTVSIKKSNCLTTVMKDNVISSLPPGRYPNAFDMKDKFRHLTPVEMCRLQTLPDDYLDGIAPNTAMSLAGNGWTVDVIAHLLRSIERKQMNDIVKEFRKITDELMFGSSETGTNVTCDKHEQNEAIRKSQNS